MSEGRRPPRPSSPDGLVDLQREFFREWSEDRSNGVSPRATFKLLKEHLDSDAKFQGETLGRLSGLETNTKRDAEGRTLEAITGSHDIPPPPKTPSFRPWWGQDPWKSVIKYALILMVGMGAGAVAHYYAIPVPKVDVGK